MNQVPRRRRISKGAVGVLTFTLLYMAVFLLASFKMHNKEFTLYFVVMCILIATVVAVHFRVGLHVGALWGLSFWGIAHIAGGLMPVPKSWPINGDTYVLYNWWLISGMLKYDNVVHAYGCGLVTWICWQALRGAFANRGVAVEATVGLLMLCVGGGMGFGAVNEIVEFIATITLPGTNVGGYVNTSWDLVSNLVGGLLVATFIYFWPGNAAPDRSSPENGAMECGTR